MTIEGAVEDEEHIWHLTLEKNAPLSVKWTFNLPVDAYVISVSNGETEIRQQVTAASVALATTELTSGQYTVQLKALQGGTELASVSQTLHLNIVTVTPTPTKKPTAKPTATHTPTPTPGGTDAPDVTPTPTPGGTDAPDVTPTPTPGGTDGPDVTPTPDTTDEPETTDEPLPTGGRWPFPNWRKWRGKGGSGSDVFVITPGKALISTHASGTGDMTVYGTVPLTLDGDTMQVLSMGGLALEVSRGGETDFQAALADDRLGLSSNEEGCWYFTQYALQTLAKSGVSALSFSTDTGSVEIPTDLTLSGMAYGRERAGGFVASDFLFMLTDDEGLFLNVEDRYYAVRDSVMIPINETRQP